MSPGGKVDRVRLRGQIQSAVPMRDADPLSPADALETQLLAAWQHVLRVPDVGVNDSLFEFGADSLVAVELITLLDQIGVSVGTAELYEHPTVTTIAAHLRSRDPRGAARFSAVVLLKQGRGNLNLVVVPGAGSSVLALFALADSLPDDLTVYGLQYPGIDDGQYRTSVADLACYFLEQIGARLPGESYGLAGTSFGGTVTFEMVRRLEQSGTRVPFLGLIDTYAPGYLTLRPQLSFRSRVRALVRWVLPLGVKHVWTAGNVASGLRQKWMLLRARLWLRGPRSRPRPHERRFQYLMMACLMASRRYQIDPVQSPIHFFSVDERLPEDLYGCDDTLGWSDASTGGVEVIQVPGRHGTHIRPPHVRTLGEKLGRAAIESLRPSSALGSGRDS